MKEKRRAGNEPEGRDGKGTASKGKRSRRLDRALDLAEAFLWIALLAVGSLVALTVFEEDSRRPPRAARSAAEVSVEAEDMRVAARSRAFSFRLQPTTDFPAGRWSKDGQMFASGTQKGDWIELELPERKPGRYRLELLLTRAADYGILTVSLNGVPIGEGIDLWFKHSVVPTGPLDLGRVELRGREDLLRFQVSGANPGARSPYFQFGIDGVRLTKE